MNTPFSKIPFYPLGFLLKMTFQNGGISLKCIPLFTVYLLRYILLEPFRLAELLIFDKRIKAHVLSQDPVFVLGHWRSGTSHLQNLLCKDPGHVTSSIFTFLFADCYFLTEAWLKPIVNALCRLFKVQYAFQRLPMNFDIPGELDPALCAHSSAHAYTWGHLFPERFEHYFDQFILPNESEAEKWINDYDYLIRKISYKQSGKRVVVKSPGDKARVEIILRRYPNAKFIYIHRDPVEVFHSSKYLWGIIQKQNSFQKITESEIESLIISSYKKLILTYTKEKTKIPAGQLAEISFNELQQHPAQSMEQVYAKLNLGPFPKDSLLPFVNENRSYKVNSYPANEILEARLKKEWPFAF